MDSRAVMTNFIFILAHIGVMVPDFEVSGTIEVLKPGCRVGSTNLSQLLS